MAIVARRLFVSYTQADAAIATRLAAGLRRAGHSVTIQASNFRPGNNFIIEMQKGLTTADHVIAVLSPAYERSEFAAVEWAAALAEDPTGAKRKLIGVRVEDYQPQGLLRAVVYVDLVGRAEAEADDLVSAAIEVGEPIGISCPETQRERRTIAVGTRPTRAAHFTGRGLHLASITDAMRDQKRVAITGLGGIGKSSLASEWVQQHESEFDLIIRIYAPDAQQADEAIGEVARELGIIEPEAELSHAEAALRSLIQSAGRTLLVLDGCRDAASALAILADADSYRLVTSRSDSGWRPSGFAQERLGPFDTGEGVEFLSSAAPDAGEDLRLVVEALGGLPIALAQAGAYMDRHAISCHDYLQRLATYAPAMFGQPTSSAYEHTVISVWSLALDDIESTSPASAWLLKLLAFTEPQDFPRGLLVAGGDALPADIAATFRDPFALDTAVANLLDHSLCGADGDGVSIHPVVQGVIRSRLSATEVLDIASRALHMIRLSQPEDVEFAAWPTWERLHPHAIAVAETIASQGIYSDHFIPVIADTAKFLHRRGNPHYANYLYAQALAYIATHPTDTNTYDVLFVMEQLAQSFHGLRAADKAAPIFRALVAFSEEHRSQDSERTITARVGLASALTDTGDHQEALSELALAAASFEKLAEPNLDIGIQLYGTLGRLLVRVGDNEQGRAHLERAVQLSEQAHDAWHVALTHIHLGNSHRQDSDAAAAKVHYERALEVASTIPGARELQAEILVNLSGLALEADDPTPALMLAEAGLGLLDQVPEGLVSVTAAVLHYQRAVIRSRTSGTSVGEVLAEAGMAFDLVCSHLPAGHRHRMDIGRFLLDIADGYDDNEIREAVWKAEPALRRDTST